MVALSLGLCWACGGDQPKTKKSSTMKVKEGKKKKEKKTKPKATTAPEEETTDAAPVSEPLPPEQIDKAKAILASVSNSDVEGVDGEKQFRVYCAACHGYDGKLAVNQAKDLSKSVISMEESVAQIYHGKGLMTPFKGVLKDHEIVAVAQYIREELRE